MAYLDNTGLGTLWGRIKTLFGAGFADLVKDSSSVTIKLQNGYGNDLDTIAIPLADSTNSKAGLMSPTEKSKLAGIASGAEVNVQADWEQTDDTADDFIKNKPTIPTVPSNIVNKITTTAGTHTAITNATGNVSFNVPTQASHVGAVPTSRKVNGKALSSDINLIAEDIGYDNGGVTTVKSLIDKQAEIEGWDSTNGTVQIGGYVGGDSSNPISTNIYTAGKINELLAGASTALDTKLEGVQINGTDLTVTNKKVNVPVFTGATTSDNGTVGLVPAPTKPPTGTPNPKGWFVTANGDFRYNDYTVVTGADSSSIGVYTTEASGGTIAVSTIALPISSTTKAGLVTSTDKTKIGYVDTGKNVTTYVSEQISTAMTGSAKYKGTVGTGGTVTALPTTGYKQGDYYVVVTAGTYAGESCEVGDMIFANKDYASGATAADDWDIVQSNITAMTTAEINAICV